MITTVQAPDGGFIKVEHPEGATQDEIISYAQAHYKPTPVKIGREGLRQAAEQLGKEMNLIGKLSAGIGAGGYNLGMGIRQLLRLGGPSAEDLEAVSGTVRGAGPIAQTSDIASSVAMTAPLAAGSIPASLAGRVATGAGLGALASGLQAVPEGNFLPEKSKQMGLGAAVGGAVPVAAGGLARVVSPNVTPQVQKLRAEGVTPTPGQMLGGGFARAEEGLSSVPILGDTIRSSQRRAIAELNAAAMNRALAPIGEKVPKNLSGREALAHVESKLSSAYDDVLPKLTTQADLEFGQRVTNLRNMVRSGVLPETEAKQFDAILKNQIINKFQGQASISGEELKGVQSELGRLSSSYSRDASFDKRQLGHAISELDASLRALVERTNPAYAQELKAINTGWANFKRVQRATSSLGAEEGLFSAAQLQSAVRALDMSKDKGSFARGTALMQDLSGAGKAVLGPKVPDSGTPFRSLMATGPIGVGAGLLSGLPGAAVYNPLSQRAIAGLLSSRPELAGEVASAIRQAGVVGPLGAPFVQDLLQ